MMQQLTGVFMGQDDFAIGSAHAVHNVKCTKNPGHINFIPIQSLTPSDLPTPFKNVAAWVAMLQARAADTVKITVEYTSSRRTVEMGWRDCVDTNRRRWGTGTAFWNEPYSNQIECPLSGCKLGDKGHPVYGSFYVVTVTHLVFDEAEAKAATVEFFDDDPGDPASVCLAEVVGFQKEPFENNRSILKCVTHDARIPERLKKAKQERNKLLEQLQEPEGCNMVVMISHPHSMSKCISIGHLLYLEEDGLVKKTRDGLMHLRRCRLCYSTPSCMGSGGGSVTLWERGRRAFAPHSKAIGPNRSLSALGWVCKS